MRSVWGHMRVTAFAAALFWFWIPGEGRVHRLCAAEPDAHAAAVIVSRNIRPYLEAVQGFKEKWRDLSGADARTFFLDQYDEKQRPLLIREIEGLSPGLATAVGPEAARFIRHELAGFDGMKIHTMILNPANVLGDEPVFCGIEIGLPAAIQVDYFRHIFPAVKRIGLLYNSTQNESFAESAQTACRAGGIQLVPLRVKERRDIPATIRDHWAGIDALWMIPDHVVVSESIIRFIIKDALSRNVPVFGFNRFFYDSGAALAFIMDYREIGGKTAVLAFETMKGQPCRETPPAFRVWYNERVLKRAGFNIPEQQPSMNIEAGP